MRTMAFVLAVGLVTSVHAEDPSATLAPKHGKIEVVPETFGKAEPLTAKATFTPKPSCGNTPVSAPGLVLRIYDRQVGDLVFDTGSKTNSPFLAEAAAPWDPNTPAGKEIQATFEPFALPLKAPPEVYFGYFQTCTTTKFICCDATGNLIRNVSTTGAPMGGGTFKLECPGEKTERCRYKQF